AVTRSSARPARHPPAALTAIAAVCLGVLGLLPAVALAAGHTGALKTVRYGGAGLRVPSSWPVFRLGRDSTVCVRFNRHAVYLGVPGSNQSCPRQAIGRTEAILVSPASYRGSLLAPDTGLGAATLAGSMVRRDDRADHLIITATWGRHAAIIRAALGLRSLRAAVLATNSRRLQPARLPRRRANASPRVTSAASPATPGEVYTGLGFDVCTTPSAKAMAAWGTSSPYAAIGIYIGGLNAACIGGNLNAGWVSAESLAGWHMLPLYVGYQAPGNGCGCTPLSTTLTNGQYATAAAQGTSAAQDAVAQAQALGIGTANPIYYDMENYRRSTTVSGAVLTFLQAWTLQLHTSGYLAGVYSSGSSGITDLVRSYGTTYVEPDELWTADWDSSAPSAPPTSTANPYVPGAYWAGTHQLLQYWSDPSTKPESYGGVKIGVDRDYVNAPTAAYGSGTLVSQIGAAPTLTIKPQPDGSVKLTPQWTGAVGVTQYAILAGDSPATLTAVQTVPTTARFPVKLRAVYHYYEVQGLNSLGQAVGSSPPIRTPGSVAIFGRSAYVGARGPVGIPVGCLNASPCQLEAQIFDGRRRIAHSGLQSVRISRGQLLVPMSAQIHRLVAAATDHRLAVTVAVTSATGAKATRPLTLIGYTASGTAPTRRTWPGSVLQILGSTSYVSNAWTGGVLAACRAALPCVATVHVTLAGKTLARAHTTTLAPGEMGYLTYGLNNQGHKLLRAQTGNQLGARLTVSTTSPTASIAPPSTAPPSS
ncbi:MAG: DUF1906 domain-containing protein, partial [Acidobacteriota bacterium]|nr:DUF1906 domain-containing protein [Acidobacteriota bacterium]